MSRNQDESDGDKALQLRDGEAVILQARKDARNVVAVEGERGGKQYHSLTAPLDFYIARRYITEEQYAAGDRLHQLWRGSILHARYARMNYGDLASGYEPDIIALMPRDYFRAMDTVGGFAARRIVRQVCCFGEFLGSRGEMQPLKSGLDDLARHFRC